MNTPVLALHDVTKAHKNGPETVMALANITMSIQPGELVAVMGPSGSGKSTLLNLAGGLDNPTHGSVLIGGVALADLRNKQLAALRRRVVGYVFQSLNLVPALTAEENVMLPRELDGISARQAREEARAALDEVSVGDYATRFPDDLSGGQQQRVAIARALVGTRRLLLADEPTGALDTATGDDVLRLLRTRCDEGTCAMLVTHDARHAGWADRVIMLRDGRALTDAEKQSANDPDNDSESDSGADSTTGEVAMNADLVR